MSTGSSPVVCTRDQSVDNQTPDQEVLEFKSSWHTENVVALSKTFNLHCSFQSIKMPWHGSEVVDWDVKH